MLSPFGKAQPREAVKGYSKVFRVTLCPYSLPPWSRLRSARSPRAGKYSGQMCKNVLVSNAGDFSTTLEMTSCSPGWRRGEGAPTYRSDLTPAKVSLYPNGYPWADEERPTLPRSINHYICHFYNVISTEVRVQTRTKRRNPPRSSSDNDIVAIFSTLFAGITGVGAVRLRHAALSYFTMSVMLPLPSRGVRYSGSGSGPQALEPSPY